MPDPQTATSRLAAATGAPDTGAPSPPSDASVATAPSPNLSSRACAADDIPTFADLKALAELMDDGYLLCRGDARPLHANAAALAWPLGNADVLG